MGSPVLQLLEASLEIPRETPEDAASGGQRVPQSHNPAYLGSLRLDTHTHTSWDVFVIVGEKKGKQATHNFDTV